MMHRARVDLPQPVSPTSPRVSPLRTSRLTPSTACTMSRCRWISRVDCTGKYLTRFSTRSRTSASVAGACGVADRSVFIAALSGLGWRGKGLADDLAAQLVAGGGVARQPARGQVRRVRADLRERRDLGAAPVHDVGAAGMERAAGR